MAIVSNQVNVDIVALGEPMVEFNQNSDGRMVQGFGGDTSNAAISAARQGARTGYITRLGKDVFGDSIIELWKRENIDVSEVGRDPIAQTGIYFVTHDDSGHHFSYYRRQSAATTIQPANLSPSYLANARILHVSAISQAISDSAADSVFSAIEIANANNTLVSYDTNLRLSLWPLHRARGVIHEAMSYCQLALPSYDDAVALTGLEQPEAIADFYLRLGVHTVALKLGSQGVLVANSDQRRMITALKVDSIDANGAGDTFAGAFLAEISNDKTPFEAARYANAAAALSTTRSGAVNAIPTRKEVEVFLQAR